MDINLLLLMIAASLISVVIYTIIGLIPGTDETSVLATVTLALFALGLDPMVILAFFIAAIVTLNLMDAIPTALTGIPGGVMSTPMVEHALVLKNKGLTSTSIKKMVVGSFIGTVVAIPLSYGIAQLLIPLKGIVGEYTGVIFLSGAIILSLLSKHKLISLISIVPFAILITALRTLYVELGVIEKPSALSISLFLGITIGPLMLRLFELLSPSLSSKIAKVDLKTLIIEKDDKKIEYNPLKIVTKEEVSKSIIGSVLGVISFFFSAVGMTVLIGEGLSSRVKNDPVRKANLNVTVLNAVVHATYLGGVLVPLIAIGIPIGSVSLGPASPLFNEAHNLHQLLSTSNMMLATCIGAVIAIIATYFLAITYASKMTTFVFKKISHEAVLALFFSFVLLIVYLEAGIINVFGIMLVSLMSGWLQKSGVGVGVLFMTLYAASYLVPLLV